MPSGLVIDALGAAFALDLSRLTPLQCAAVREAWSGAVHRGAVPGLPQILPVEPGDDTTVVLARLSQRVTRAAIDRRGGDGWMLHAAAVADETGAVVVLVGASGAGKTTAVRALGRRWAYVTDETVFIDPAGGVAPYRKPLSVVRALGAAKAQVSPDAEGLRALPPAPLRVAALVLLDRQAAPCAPTLLAEDLSDALPLLVAQSSHLADMDRPLQMIARVAHGVGGIFRLRYAEASDLEPTLEHLFSKAASRSHALAPSTPGGDGPSDPTPVDILAAAAAAPEPRYVRAPFTDALALGPRTAVLCVGKVTVLDGIAPAVWRAAATPATLPQLAAAAVERHGAPDGEDAVTRATRAAVATLVDAGLLRRAPGWRIRSDVAWTGARRRYVALSLEDLYAPHPVAMEGTAGAIWGALAASPGIDEHTLAHRVARDFAADPELIVGDVAGFLRQLVDARLVEACAGEPDG